MTEEKMKQDPISTQIKFSLLYGGFSMLVYSIAIPLMSASYIVKDNLTADLFPITATIGWFIAVLCVAGAAGYAIGDRKTLNVFLGSLIVGIWNALAGIIVANWNRGLISYDGSWRTSQTPALGDYGSLPLPMEGIYVLTLLINIIVTIFFALRRRSQALQTSEIIEEEIEIRPQTTEEFLESELSIDD